MAGVPLKAVQELLGHANMEMTLRYAHLSPESRRQAVCALDTRCCHRPPARRTGRVWGLRLEQPADRRRAYRDR